MRDKNNETNKQLVKEIDLLKVKVADLEKSKSKHKQVEAELLESEQRFKAFINNSTEGISVADLEGNYSYVNPTFFKMVGWTEEELLKMTVFDVTADKQDTATFKRTKTAEEGLPVVVNLKRKDGSIFIAEVTGKNISFKGKKRVLGSIRDITETKKSERVIRESEEYFKALIENSADVISAIDSKGNNTYQSPSYNRIMGYLPEERIGKSAFELIHPDDKNRLSLQLANILKKTGASEQISFRFLHKDGSWHHFEGTARNMLNLSSINGIILNYRDVTRRKKAEKEIKKLSAAVEQSANTIILTDTKGNIEYTNPKFTELTGYTAAEALGQNPRILNADTQSKGYYAEMWKTITKGGIWKGEFHNRTKSGELFWEQVTITPIKNEEGIIKNYLAVKEDITERKKVQQELIIAKEKAEESDRLKSAFLANMSHEIRTPMNGIMGFANLLKKPGLTGVKQQKYISIIEIGGKRMLNIINDLVDISKIEAGQMELSISEVNINEQMEYLHTFFKPEAERKGLNLSYTTGLDSDEAVIDSDREKLYAILTNLIKNAVKYTLHGSVEFGYSIATSVVSPVSPVSTGSTDESSDTINSETEPVESSVVEPVESSVVEPVETTELKFYVKDSGIGIEKNKQKSIFQRFVQADSSLSSDFEGAGLGLSITQAYLEMLGGKIWMESDFGKGSIFYFTIPFNTKSKPIILEEEAFIITDSSINLRKLKILIAEDDETSEIYLDTLLEDINKNILHARTGVEAVELCQKNPDIDLILMDIKMPEMNGYDASLKIREFNKDVIIIAQTAYSLTGDKEKALTAGCNDYITKPIDKQVLMEKIEGLIKK